MNDLNDTATRRRLAARYVEADTTLQEERELKRFYAHAQVPLDDDERQVQALITSPALSAGDMALTAEKAQEFDDLMQERPATKVKPYWWAAVAAAAAIVAILLVFPFNTQVKVASRASAPVKIAARAAATAPAAVCHASDVAPVPRQEHEPVAQRVPPATARAAPAVHKGAPRSEAAAAETVQQRIDDLLAVVNLHGAQVESYKLQPRGDATVVTATMADGSLVAYMVSSDADDGSTQLIPINVE